MESSRHSLFIMFAHDLKPPDVCNYLLKYADDSSMLSPQNSPTPLEMEIAHVLDWAREQNESLKTVKLVFRRPNVSGDLLPPALSDIKRVCDAKLSISNMILISPSTLILLLLHVM